MSADIIPIFAAVSPTGDIVKSSISPFRVHAQRYAVSRKNFSVVKLMDLNVEIKTVEPTPVPENAGIVPQTVRSTVKVPQMKTKRTRRAKTTEPNAA